jgi:hypothetical protein
MARRGRSTARGGTGNSSANDSANVAAQPAHADDVALAKVMRRYDQLGDESPKINVAGNDAAHGGDGAHTLNRHSPDLPLRRDPTTKTIEGRICGDEGWSGTANRSFQWSDHTTMNRAVNAYVLQNWEAIRSDLSISQIHEGTFDAGHRVGRGFYNNGMYGAGPREARYGEQAQ